MNTVAALAIPITVTGASSAQSQLDGVTKSSEKAGATAEWLEGMIGKLAAAFGAMKVAQFIKSSADLAAQYEMLGAAMGAVGKNAGHSTAEMEMYEQKIQSLGISMKASRVVLTQMASANMDLEKSAKLARMAQDAGTIGMVNSSEAMMRMVNGIRSGETESLKALGITVNNEQVYKRLAKTLGTTVEGLSDNEKQQARLNAVLEKSTAIAGAYEARMGTAGGTMMSMERIAEDLQTSFGKVFLPAYTVIVADLKKELEGLAGSLKQDQENGELMAQSVLSMTLSMRDGAQSTNDLINALLGLDSTQASLLEGITAGEIAMQGLALVMGVIIDVWNVFFGTLQAIWGGLESIISGVIYGVTKLIGMLGGFEPPKWMDDWLTSSSKTAEKGMNTATKFMTGQGATAQAYTGENAAAVKDAQKAARDKTKVSPEEAAKQKAIVDKRFADEQKVARAVATSEQARLKMTQDIQGKIAEAYASQDPAQAFYQKNVEWLKKLQTDPAWKSLDAKTKASAIAAPKLLSEVKDNNIIRDQEKALQKVTMTTEELAMAEAKEKGIRSQALQTMYASTLIEIKNAEALKTTNEALQEIGVSEMELIAIRVKRAGLNPTTQGAQEDALLKTKIDELNKATEEYGKTEEQLMLIQFRRITGTTLLTAKTKELADAMSRNMENKKEQDFKKSVNPFSDSEKQLADEKNRINQMDPNQKTDPNQALTDQEMALTRLGQKYQELGMAQLKFRAQSGDTWAAVKMNVLDAVSNMGPALGKVMMESKSLGDMWLGVRDIIKNMLKQILESVLNYMIQMMIVAPIVNGLLAMMGMAPMGGGGAAKSGAVGGNFGAGQKILVGERGPEWFVPSVPGTIIPNNQIQGGSSVNSNVQVQVNIASDGSAKSDAKSNEAAGRQLGTMIEATIANWYQQQSRPNGTVFNSIRAARA